MSDMETAIEMTRKTLDTCESDAQLRIKETAFTRHRQLGAKNLLLVLLHRLIGPLQLGIDALYAFICAQSISKQAFSKARANLNPEFVRKFADGIAEIFARKENAPTYRGMRLIAIDGTSIALENSPELREIFGCCGPQEGVATARGSLAYGPLDQAIYDCQIAPYKTDERELAKLHIARLLELGLGGSLLLFDRWYPSKDLIAHTLENGFSLVMRVRDKWNLDVDAVKADAWVSFSWKKRAYRIRVLKATLPSGEVESLLTNLSEEQLPLNEAADLYFRRWGIETAYDILKSKLQLENFSGKTAVSVRQDFYATVYLAAFASICAAEANIVIDEHDAVKELKYVRKASRNRTIAKLRDQFWRILFEDDPTVRSILLDRLVREIAARPESIRPGRSPARNRPRNKRFHIVRKSVLH